MNQLQNFVFENQQVRVIQLNNKPWFVAGDVCKVLEIKNTTDVVKRLDEDEVTRFNLGGLSGETNIVNEPGLYTLILGSRKPEAKQFKRWITHEVLPSIRKHGAYMTPETIEQVLLNPDTIIQLATNLKAEQQKRLAAETAVLEANQIVQAQQPKVIFADAIQASNTCILVSELAKLLKQNGIEMGQKRLFEWLRENGYLIKRKGTDYNTPTQRSMELKLFEIKETPIHRTGGEISISRTSKVTGKGQKYFINKFLNGVTTCSNNLTKAQ